MPWSKQVVAYRVLANGYAIVMWKLSSIEKQAEFINGAEAWSIRRLQSPCLEALFHVKIEYTLKGYHKWDESIPWY